ncbi:MAG: CIA30 family protein [Brevinematales bacterium]|jgi:hypothetical protein
MLKRAFLFCFAAAACFMIQGFAGAESLTLINDFENQQTVTAFGGSWFTVNDAANNGSSVAEPMPFVVTKIHGGGAGGSDCFAKLTGKVTVKFQYGFIAMDCDLVSNAVWFDLTKYKGIKLAVRGDGKDYKLQIRAPINTDYCYYTHILPTTASWTALTLPFDTFKQESWGKFTDFNETFQHAIGLQFQTTTQPIPSVDLEIDDIYLYK